ncbi:hypothetical protein B0J11DRAFT_462656 [Dendryphion nanum]|uniref:C2H2-type domain-containing protein n=1 Tax=Dendryphion nanum TaxID=256645 RepID=A0A9P9DQ07_9PLEO|nr:hypothetical protein B0J11DRAFT_462656 [Dendryphion nanum]
MVYHYVGYAYCEPVRGEHVCTICGKHFSSDSNLRHHKYTHLPADVQCYGCERMFTTYAGMIIHLESGACSSGINVFDLNQSAAMGFGWKKWTVRAFQNSLLNCEPVKKGDCPFKCPTCDVTFPKLSSLFMHVASPSCDQELDEGAIKKLRRWLWRRHDIG